MVVPRLGRLLRHGFTTPWTLRRAFPPPVLARIEDAITAAESQTTGEIRFAVEAVLPWSYLRRDAPARERALMVFSKLGVWDTEENNGVLIYVELADHSVEIAVDRAIARRVAQREWQTICDAMRARFRQGDFEGGVIAGIQAVGAQLATHFPLASGQPNPDEAPNAPAVL